MHDDARCRGCGYLLKGLPSGACPECGQPFNWTIPSTYRTDGNWLDPEADVHHEHKRSVTKRSIILGLLLAVGLLPALLTNVWAGYGCCITAIVFPLWQIACVVSLLSVVSPTGTLGVPESILIGIIAGLLLGLPIGLFGVAFGATAGLLGALLFKQFELNNML